MVKWRELYGHTAKIVCPYCLKTVKFKDTNIEHVLPKSRGGQDVADNKIRVCKKCNSEKGALTVDEYIEWKRLNAIRNGSNHR